MQILQHTDVYRTYDVTSILSLPTTLDRLAEMLKGAERHPEIHGLLNVEDEVYVAAADGSSPARRLTQSSGRSTSPVWSPALPQH